jgi:hypothetical protein
MDTLWAEERSDGAWERAWQEREVAVSHSLTEAEHALVREGVQIGRALAAAGLAFDASTFVAMRVLEASVEENLDPVHALRSSALRDLIERSAEVTTRILTVAGS